MTASKEFFVGGYYLVEGADLSDWVDSKLLPPKLWSFSSCLNVLHPAFCSIEWYGAPYEEREKYRKGLNLSEQWFVGMQNDVEARFDKGLIGWGEMFLDLDTARGHAAAYLGDVPDVKLLMIALEGTHRDRFLKEEVPEEGHGEPGVFLKLKEGVKADLAQGTLRGFDVLGYDLGSFHSFMCNQLEGVFHKDLGLEFNKNGLFDAYEDAARASAFVDEGNVGAEPGLWLPWAVTELPLKV